MSTPSPRAVANGVAFWQPVEVSAPVASTRGAPLRPTIPPVSDIEATNDREWFAAHRGRLFRARRGDGGVWLVRRQGGALLRTYEHRGRLGPDTDVELAERWYRAAFPDWDVKRLKAAARRALRP